MPVTLVLASCQTCVIVSAVLTVTLICQRSVVVVASGAVHEQAPDGDVKCHVVGVLPGPYANPDYFTDDDIKVFYSTAYEVHYNSNRWVSWQAV